MTKLRNQLTALTTDLRALGVTVLAYPDDLIHAMSRGQLVSCIEWATSTIDHIRAA